MASYPGALPTFTPKQNITDLVNAQDVNVLYDEVSAGLSTLGISASTRVVSWSAGSFNTSTTSYPSVAKRIENVETGTYIVYNDYISKTSAAGNNTIIPSGTSTVNLTLKLRSGQTANAFDVKDSSDVVIASVNKDGVFRAVGIDGGSA